MNQENKSGEFKEKLLQYWAAFVAFCGKLWEYVKVNGKALLEKLAQWFAVGKDWLIRNTADLRAKGKALLQDLGVKGKAAMESLSVWLAGMGEKLRPVPGQIRDWCVATVARLKGGSAPETAEALPAAEEPKALPEAAAEETPVETSVSAETESEKPVKAPVETGNPYLDKGLVILAVAGRYLKITLKWIWKLRRIFMAIPVIWAAVKLAMQNMDRLPEQVGLDIQSTGEFARMITREEAVWWPLGITAFCLLLMFCSKKPILPWVISIFTLVLPWLIWILNYYA